MKINNNIIILSLKTMLLLSVACCNFSCIGRSHYQTISHNKLRGKTDYVHFTSVDTGYMITHLGELYLIDSIRCTYVYQTVNGGAYWEIVDSVPNYSFRKYSHITHKNIVYGYMEDGTLDEYWNSYLCLIDLKKHRHRVRNEAINGPGDVFVINDSIYFYVFKYKGNVRPILRLDDELNNLFCDNDILPKRIENISYNDSSLAIITYDDKMYYLQSGKMSEYQIDLPCNEILISGNDCFISYWGDKHNGGMIRHDCLSDNYDILDFPAGYEVVEILKASNDSIIITCTKEDARDWFCEDIVYSTDRGNTWKKIHLADPITSIEENSCYCAPYLYIKSTLFSEIYKLRIE